MSLIYRYDFIDESRASRFRLYELFDMNKLIDELNNISIEIENLGFNISIGWKKKPVPKDQSYTYPSFRWELVCLVKLGITSYKINIVNTFNSILYRLYDWDGQYIDDKNLQKFVFGDINRNSISTADVYNTPIIIKDLILLLKQYR